MLIYLMIEQTKQPLVTCRPGYMLIYLMIEQTKQPLVTCWFTWWGQFHVKSITQKPDLLIHIDQQEKQLCRIFRKIGQVFFELRPSQKRKFYPRNRAWPLCRVDLLSITPVIFELGTWLMGSSTVSDVHFGHFSHALHPGIESAATFSCHTLQGWKLTLARSPEAS